jgi:4-amino-4-deoxy-L-arabinose transferase-like glycosyltransferase
MDLLLKTFSGFVSNQQTIQEKENYCHSSEKGTMKLSNSKLPFFFKVFVLFVLGFRLLLVIIMPLLDKTEARYAEVARKMYETGDWVVMQIDYGVPFWAKPPLSTWLSAAGFEIFGVNEFGARIASFLIAIFVIYLLTKWRTTKTDHIYLLGFILLTTPEFLIHAGVTSTDSALLLSITLVMWSFWKRVQDNSSPLWGYLFFVGIGLGMLAKGPIVIILTGPPVFIWCLLDRDRWSLVFKRLPWFLGILLVLSISIPWYWLMEERSPGFLDYFFVGEHYKRYFEPGWSGDRYGYVKSQAKGIVWLWLLVFCLPWIQILIYKIWKRRRSILSDSYVSFLVLWLFWTPVFFSLSGSVIHTYVLPCTVPMALLLVHWWKDDIRTVKVTAAFPILSFLTFLVLISFNQWRGLMKTDAYLIQSLKKNNATTKYPLYYWKYISYSGRFYGDGKVELIDSKPGKVEALLKIEEPVYLFVKNKEIEEIPEEVMEQFTLIESNKWRSVFCNKSKD